MDFYFLSVPIKLETLTWKTSETNGRVFLIVVSRRCFRYLLKEIVLKLSERLKKPVMILKRHDEIVKAKDGINII